MSSLQPKKIVLLGTLTKHPVGGVIWQYVHYLLGFERLGYEVYYVESGGHQPSWLLGEQDEDRSRAAAAFIDATLRRLDLGDRWAFHARYADDGYYGMTERQLRALYHSADLIINLHGATEPLPEHAATGRLVYLETDPVELQTELYEGRAETISFLKPHAAFFSYAENYGRPDCLLPVAEQFPFKPTRQPVVLDFWRPDGDDGDDLARTFTTIGNWHQGWRKVTFNGEVYHWSKQYELLKIVDLPSHTPQSFELALTRFDEGARWLLEDHGWSVVDALGFTLQPDQYRRYIAASRGELTVAKDQNIRLRSGWFSDRSACYLAAGRPVITQETGFSNILPTGAGLFAFASLGDILEAIEQVNADYRRHRAAALAVAHEYFNSDVVLGRLLQDVGLPARIGRRPRRAVADPCVTGPSSELPSTLPVEAWPGT